MSYTFDALDDAAATASANTITLAPTYTAGQSALLWIRWITGASVTISTVADGTNTYTQVGTTLVDAGTSSSYALFYLPSAAAGAVTITVTFSAATTFRAIGCWRASGLANSAAQGSNRQAQTGTTALSSGNITPSSQPAALVGFFYDDNATGTITAGNVTNRGNLSNLDATFGVNSRVGDLRLTTTSAVAATATAGTTSAVAVSFAAVLTEAGAAAALHETDWLSLETRPEPIVVSLWG